MPNKETTKMPRILLYTKRKAFVFSDDISTQEEGTACGVGGKVGTFGSGLDPSFSRDWGTFEERFELIRSWADFTADNHEG